MKQRIITSIVIVAVGLPIILFSNLVIYQAALTLLSIVAAYEVLGVFEKRKNLYIAIPAYAIAAAFPLASYWVKESWQRSYILLMAMVLFGYLVWLFAVAVFHRGALKFGEVTSTFALIAYITVAFCAMGLIRRMGGDDRTVGLLYLLMVFGAAWITDVFAYFTGYFFGKHKLIPEVSPKKTVEGSLGGIFFAVAVFLLFGLLMDFVTDYTVNYLVLGLSAFVLSIVSQIGDLVASLVKREHGIKDYGFLFPGHGGVMDRFDSIIAVACPVMIICQLWPPFY